MGPSDSFRHGCMDLRRARTTHPAKTYVEHAATLPARSCFKQRNPRTIPTRVKYATASPGESPRRARADSRRGPGLPIHHNSTRDLSETGPSRGAPQPAAVSGPLGFFFASEQAPKALQPALRTKPPARPVHPPAVVRAHHPGAKAVPPRGFTIGGACGRGRAGAFFEPSRGAAGADAPGVRAAKRGRSAGGTGAPSGRRCAPRFHQDAARPPI